MFKSIKYHNFKVLRDTTLPLGRFNLVVGPNGSGKSTALQALRFAALGQAIDVESVRSINADDTPSGIAIEWNDGNLTTVQWLRGGGIKQKNTRQDDEYFRRLPSIRFYGLAGEALAVPVQLQPQMELAANGTNLAGVLDRLRDTDPERFQRLNTELMKWLPEFDQILFETPSAGMRQVLLRAKGSKRSIRAYDLSDGTLFALAMLTMAYSSAPPPFVAIEEPERGIHPRLLRRVQDALYRLAYPESHNESRKPVQVVATTHSPLFLDLYREHPEEIVVAEKLESEARFVRLVEKDNLKELLEDAPLGDLWYSGILGGVPLER